MDENHSTDVVSLIFILLGIIFIILPYVFIFSKTGYSKWLGVLMVVPGFNFILLYFLAFSRWPVLIEKKIDHD